MKKMLLVLILILSACGKSRQVDPVFDSYIETFKAEGLKRGKTVEVNFSVVLVDSLESQNYGGICNSEGVQILKSLWNDSSSNTKEALIYHELGHCALGRQHSETRRTDGFPESVMVANWSSASFAIQYLSMSAYWDELFK